MKKIRLHNILRGIDELFWPYMLLLIEESMVDRLILTNIAQPKDQIDRTIFA